MQPKIGLLLDRLRLTSSKGPNSTEERALIDAVLKVESL